MNEFSRATVQTKRDICVTPTWIPDIARGQTCRLRPARGTRTARASGRGLVYTMQVIGRDSCGAGLEREGAYSPYPHQPPDLAGTTCLLFDLTIAFLLGCLPDVAGGSRHGCRRRRASAR
jgi:hypothetical protein